MYKNDNLRYFKKDAPKPIIEQVRFSLFTGGIRATKPEEIITFWELMQIISNDTQLKKEIDTLRSSEYGTKEYSVVKEKLPYFTPSGVFISRSNKNIKAYSQIICFDYDYKDNPEVDILVLKTYLRQDDFVLSFFDSPSGKGLKILTLVNTGIDEHTRTYKEAMSYFETKYSIKLDASQGTLSQACFLSYDNKMQINYSCDVFIPVENKIPKTSKQQTTIIRSQEIKDSVEFAKYLVENRHKQAYKEGNRNVYVSHLAQVSNRLGIDKDVVKGYFQRFDNSFYDEAEKVIEANYRRYSHDFASYPYKPRTKQLKGEAYEVAKQVKNMKLQGDSVEQITESLKKQGLSDTNQLRTIVAKAMPSKMKFIEKHLLEHYNISKNQFTGFIYNDGQLISDELINTILISMQYAAEKSGMKGIDKDSVLTFINSKFIKSINPISEFIEKHSGLDYSGTIDKIINTVNTDTPYFKVYFKKWIVNLVAMLFEKVDNPLLLVLVGKKYTGKTHFFRNLLPERLLSYMTEMRIDISYEFDLALAQNILILDDEFDSRSKTAINTLKKVLSKNEVDVRIKYDKFSYKYKRNASVCATSNDFDIIDNAQDNRKIIPINFIGYNQGEFNSIQKEALFMEAYDLYKNGFNYKLNIDDIKELDEHSEQFHVRNAEKEAFLQAFNIKKHGGCNKLWTSNDIVNKLNSINQIRFSSKKLHPILKELEVPSKTFKRDNSNGKKSSLVGYFVEFNEDWDIMLDLTYEDYTQSVSFSFNQEYEFNDSEDESEKGKDQDTTRKPNTDELIDGEFEV